MEDDDDLEETDSWGDYEDDDYAEDDDMEEDDMEEDDEDTGLDYIPGTVWLLENEEYEPDPDEEDVEEKVRTPIEIINDGIVLRRYCTSKQAREECAKYRIEMEKNARLNPPKEPEPVEWVADDLYGTVVGGKGPVGRNPAEVDPSLLHREPEPIVWTAEDEYIYGPLERASPPPMPHNDTSAVPPVADANPPNLTQSMATMSLNDVPEGDSSVPDVSAADDGDPTETHPDLMKVYEENFRLIPGDVIMFVGQRYEPATADSPAQFKSMVHIYEDRLYFEDHGQFRLNFLDKYPLEEGDVVIRFGNFNKWWRWNRHSSINVYMYWPGLKPPPGSDKKILHPWYWINHGILQYGGSNGMTLPILSPLTSPYTPIGATLKDFKFRNGDMLIHFDYSTESHVPPFDHKMQYRLWNPVLESIGQEKFLRPHLRVLRHGMNFQYQGSQQYGTSTNIVHVELFYFDQDGNWRFLGRCTTGFMDHIRRGPAVRPLGTIPLAGDIIFDRSTKKRKTGHWDPNLNVGGLVSFHKYEAYKFFGRETRPFVWYKDAGKYGKGNITMVLRLGRFLDDDSEDWVWRPAQQVQLFILNTRGSSWRLNSAERWPDYLPLNKPNYSWKPYNPADVREVPPSFGPQAGDVIIRLHVPDLEERLRRRHPQIVGMSFNPHYQVKVEMGIYGPHLKPEVGDFLIRAGYEKNEVNEKWTNATVECYLYEFNAARQLPVWVCKGRDVFVFGTEYMSGGLRGVEVSGFGDYSVGDIQSINASPHRQIFGVTR